MCMYIVNEVITQRKGKIIVRASKLLVMPKMNLTINTNVTSVHQKHSPETSVVIKHVLFTDSSLPIVVV